MAKNKKKKKTLASKIQHRTKVADVKSNPFEVKINKQKHSILGKKNKHGKGMPAVSRSKGLQKVFLEGCFLCWAWALVKVAASRREITPRLNVVD